jgi:hypothetical protein
MPITLGCPSCGKRFKARDESAGKRVKCPYCGAAVTVPTAEEAAVAAAPTMAIPPTPTSPPPAAPKPSPLADSGPIPVPSARPASTSPAARPAPAPVATPDDWGAEPPMIPERPRPAAAAPEESTAPFPMMPAAVDRSKKEFRAQVEKKAAPRDPNEKTPEQILAAAWRKTRSGLFWVLFALLLLAIPGLVGFAKVVLPRAGVEIPSGDGWVIPGYVNTNDQGSIRMKKQEQIDVLAYAVPVILGGLALTLGRMTCGAAPRNSGAKGLFAMSGLFTFFALAALVTSAACEKLLWLETYRLTGIAFLILGSVAEFWFLTSLAASGVALKRPKAARAVGLIGFCFALTAAVATLGWTVYEQQLRPKQLDDDWRMYEQAALMIGWLLLIGVYWRAVGTVRGAIREFIDSVSP